MTLLIKVDKTFINVITFNMGDIAYNDITSLLISMVVSRKVNISNNIINEMSVTLKSAKIVRI
jgi:hypothetical protein